MPSDREDKTLPSSSDGAAPCVSPPALEKGSHEEKEGEEDADEDEEAAEECRESPRLLSSHPASASRCLREDFHGEKEAGCGGGSSETRKTKSTESERVPVPSQKARFVLERRQSRQSEQKRQGDRDPQGREKTGRRPYGRNKHAAYHASSPIVPFICKPDGLSSVAATQRIIEAVESLVHEFRRAGRGTSSRPLLAASSGRSASLFRTPFLLPCACGPYVSFLYHFVSSLPAAETGVAAAALLASAAMCVVCCLLSNNEASLVSFVRFVIFLPPVLLAAWLAYRSRTIEHLRAVSKLQEALDEFKTETGFASLSGPLSPSQLSPSSSAPRRPGSSALFSHAASSQASSQCPGDEASFIGKETAAHASSPVFRKDERAQAEGLLCSSSGLGGDYPPDYSRLSPAQLFAALQVLVGDSADARFSSLSCSGEAATGRSSAVLHAFEKRPASRLLPAKSGDAVEGKKESRAGAEAVREATAQRTAKGEKRREDKDATGADFAPDDHLPAASLVAVLRDSQWQRVPRNMLAAGDVFKLRPGDPLPCDAVRVVPAFLVSRRHRLNAGGPRRQESPSGMSHRSEHGRAVSACVPPRSELHGERQRTASKAPSPHTGGGPSLRETPSRSLSATALKLSLPSSSRPHSSSSPARSLSESSGSSSRSRSLSRSLSRYLSRSCASSRSSPSSAASSPASQRSTRLVLRPVFSAGVYRVGTVFLPFGSDPARRTGARRASSSLSVSPLTSSPLAGSADGEERAREPRTSSLARFLSPHHGTKRPRRGDRTQRADAPRERLDGASALASSGWESVSRRQAFDADAAYARPRSTQLCPSPSDSDKNDSSRSASRPGRRLRASSPRRRKAFSGASSDASGRRHSPVDSPPRPSRRPYASSRKPRRRGSSPLSFSVDPAGSSSRFKIARGASAGREGRRGRRSREESRRRDALTGREGGEDSRKRSRPSRVSGTTAEQGRDAVRSEGDNQLPSRERRRRTDREDGGASWRSSRRGASDQTRKRRLRDSGKKRWLSDVDEGYWLDSSEDDARSNGHRRRRDLHDDGLRGDGRRDKSARRHLDVRSRRERERGERGRDRHREREKERGREREKESSRARGRERDREGEGRRRRRRERERREESGEPGHASTTLRIRRLSDGDKERGRSGSCGASVAQREERQTCVNRREARERALHGSSRHGNGQGLEDCTERWRASETLAVAAESSFEDETRGRQPLLQAHFKTKSKYVCASLADREATRPLRPRLLGNAPMHSRAPHGDSDDYLLSTRNRENDISETQNAGARPESHSASLTSPPSLPLRFLDFFSRPADQHPTSGLGRKDRESDSGGERGDAGRIGLAASCEEAKQKAAWWEVEELEEELIEAANNDGVAGELKSGTFIALRTSCVGTLRSFLEASLRNPASSKSRAKVPFFEAADLVSRQLAVVWLVACTVCIVFVILWDVIARTGDEVVPLGLRIARWQLPINVTFCMLMAIPRILGELTDIWGNARLQSLFQEAHYRARKDACVDMEGEGRVCRSISSSSWTTDDSSAASSVSSTVSVSNVPISKQIKELIYIFKRGLDGSSNLLHTMNSTTVLCFVDKDGILVDACRTLQEVAVGASSTVHVPAPEAAREASGLPGSPSLHLAGGGQSGTVGTREEEGEEEQEHEQSDDEHESGQGAPDEAARPDREQEEGGREDPNEHDEHDEREEGDERGDHLHSPSLFFANPEDECVDGGFYSFLPVGEHAAPFTLGRKPKSTRMRSTTTGPGAARAADTRAKAMKRQEREGEEREEPTRVSVWRSKDFEPSDERCDQLRRERDSVHSKNDDGSGMTRELPSSIPATDTEAGQREKSGACVDSAHAEASERSRELPEERLETEEANALPREARNKRSFFSFTATRPSEQSRQLLEPLGAPRRLPTEEEEFQESAMQSRDESPASSPARLPSSLASSVASLLPSLQRSRAATQKRSREAGRADERDALRERREGADGRAHGPEGEEEREHEGEEDARQTSGDSETEERREDAEWGVSAVDAERFVQSDLSEEHDEEGDERGEERRSEEARREDREEEERRVEEERRADEAHGLREEEEDYTRERHAQDSQVLLRPVTEFRKVVLDLMNDDECVVGLRFENDSWIEYSTQLKALALAMALTQLPRTPRQSLADPSWLFSLYVQDVFLPHPDRQAAHEELLDCQCSLAKIVGCSDTFLRNFLPLRFILAVAASLPPRHSASLNSRPASSSRLRRLSASRAASPRQRQGSEDRSRQGPEGDSDPDVTQEAANATGTAVEAEGGDRQEEGAEGGDEDDGYGDEEDEGSDVERARDASAARRERWGQDVDVSDGETRDDENARRLGVNGENKHTRAFTLRRVRWADTCGVLKKEAKGNRKTHCKAATEPDKETPSAPNCDRSLALQRDTSEAAEDRGVFTPFFRVFVSHRSRPRACLRSSFSPSDDSGREREARTRKLGEQDSGMEQTRQGGERTDTDPEDTERDERDEREDTDREDEEGKWRRESADEQTREARQERREGSVERDALESEHEESEVLRESPGGRASDGDALMLWVVRDIASNVAHLFVKGVPALLLPRVKFYLDGQQLLPFDAGAAHSLLELNNQWLSTGLDAVAFGYRPLQLDQEDALLSLLHERSLFSLCTPPVVSPTPSAPDPHASRHLPDDQREESDTLRCTRDRVPHPNKRRKFEFRLSPASVTPQTTDEERDAEDREARDADERQSEERGDGREDERDAREDEGICSRERWISVPCHVGEISAMETVAPVPRVSFVEASSLLRHARRRERRLLMRRNLRREIGPRGETQRETVQEETSRRRVWGQAQQKAEQESAKEPHETPRSSAHLKAGDKHAALREAKHTLEGNLREIQEGRDGRDVAQGSEPAFLEEREWRGETAREVHRMDHRGCRNSEPPTESDSVSLPTNETRFLHGTREKTEATNSLQHAEDAERQGDELPAFCLSLNEDAGGELLRRLQSHLILLGMGASKQLCAKEVAARIQDLHEAGIRFVFFSSQDEKRTRALGAAFGLETGWNCIISLQPTSGGDTSYVNMDGKIVLPSGIAAIRQHVEEVDNVPLQVSLFCNSTPDTVQEMMQVLQENNEVMTCVGSCLRTSNFPLFEQANASIATFVAPDARCKACGGRWSPVACDSSLPTLNPSLAFAADLNSLPCALQQSSYPVADPHVTMAVIYEAFRESRRIVDSIQQSLTLCLSSSIFLSLFFLFNSFAFIPNLLDLVSLLLFLLLFIPLLSLALLLNPKTDKLMKEYPYKPMDPTQTQRQLLVVFMHFAVRLVPSVIVISALSLTYMFNMGHDLYGDLRQELQVRSALSASLLPLHASPLPRFLDEGRGRRLEDRDADGPRENARGSEGGGDKRLEGTRGKRQRSRDGSAETGEERETKRDLTSEARFDDLEGKTPAQLLEFLERKCNNFRFGISWLSGKWLACGDAMKDTGSVLGEASLVCAASTPLVLGELFCFTLVGVTLMLLSMSYIDRFESLLAIPPVRNRWWLASCALLTVVIALTVTTRVTLHRRYLDSAACQESRKAEFSSSAVFSGSSRPFQSEGALGAEGGRMAAPEQRAGNDRPEAAGRADVHARPQETRKFTNYAALIWPHWSLCLLAGLLWIFVVIVDELVKRVERQTHEHHQKYLKVLFATRLGMWSPK